MLDVKFCIFKFQNELVYLKEEDRRRKKMIVENKDNRP